MKLKIILSYVLLILWLGTNLAHATSSPITQIELSPQLKIVPMQVNDLPEITSVITTGKFAWAIDNQDNSVAFFNGTNWMSAQTLAGMNNLAVYPTYPLLGTQPTAWAIGGGNVSYFDGSHWQTPQSALAILGLQNKTSVEVALAASGGYAYLIGIISDPASPAIVYSVNDASSHLWSKPLTIAGAVMLNFFDSMNDTHPAAFVLTKPTLTASLMLNRINIDGSTTSYALPYSNLSSNNAASVLVDNNNTFVGYSGDNRYLSFNSSYTTSGWNEVVDASTHYGPQPNNVSSGIVCEDNYDFTSNQLSLDCIDSNIATPQWLSATLVKNPQLWQLFTKANGAWLGYQLSPTLTPTIEDYTITNNQAIDTHYPTPYKPLYNVYRMLKPIMPDSLIVCNWNEKTDIKPQLFYYDAQGSSSQWQKIDTSDINVANCGFSNGGNSSHIIKNLNVATGETLWLFNDPSFNNQPHSH